MEVIAATHENPDMAFRLRVKSNPFGACHLGHSITIRSLDYPGATRYKTVSDFLGTWRIHVSDRRNIPVPFLSYERGLGDAVRYFAECFPLWIKKWFRGCEDRRTWMNHLAAFVPIGWKPDEDEDAEE